ncbi:MAG: transcriptional regulator [Arcobacter sp.]|nr:MAG: transcriptional regulator [Arcobacter sp.]
MVDELKNMELLKTKSVLYLEDEENIRNTLISTLKLMCKEVYAFATALDALNAFSTLQPDIILTDVSLGEMTGIEFIQKIRKFDSKIPIIILSAHTDTDFLLEASKLKLVEYLTKPTNFKELQKSFFLALEEIQSNTQTFVNISDTIEYDTSHKILYDNGVIKKLTASERKLLEFFIHNKNRTIYTQEIKNHIWEDSYYATDTALKSLLHKLRHKIGKDSIKNVSGIGYYFNQNKSD